MTSRPAIPETPILATLRGAYGLAVERLAFMTTGWVSSIYRVDVACGARYLLKVVDERLPEPTIASSLEFYLPLCHELCRGGWLPQIACPVAARDGRFSVEAGPYRLIVFEFIEGERVGFGRLPDDVLARLATLTGRLHASTPHLTLANPLVEHFAIAFEQQLPAWLEALAGPSPRSGRAAGGDPGWRRFQEVLVPRRAELLGRLGRLKELQAVMRAGAPERVVVHTDLHGNNLLRGPAGELYILDWEGAQLAPPEHDLFMFVDDERFWSLFWPNYAREHTRAALNPDALAFYLYRRGLEDLADWLQRLIAGVDDDDKERQAIHWARETVDGLGGVESLVPRVADRGKPRSG
jgi:hypothetical protein